MGWERIDDRPLRNTGGSKENDRALARRVYGWEGSLWPRLTIAIYPREVMAGVDGERGFIVAHALKESTKHWWDSHGGIPCELYDDVREMLEEAGHWWKRRDESDSQTASG